ncbi:MAG: winged helix DNA-binding protein [Candidatus Hydrothermarchaeota archaeon]
MNQVKLTHVETKVLEFVKRGEFKNITQCAQTLKYPVVTILETLKSLEKKGLIEKVDIKTGKS